MERCRTSFIGRHRQYCTLHVVTMRFHHMMRYLYYRIVALSLPVCTGIVCRLKGKMTVLYIVPVLRVAARTFQSTHTNHELHLLRSLTYNFKQAQHTRSPAKNFNHGHSQNSNLARDRCRWCHSRDTRRDDEARPLLLTRILDIVVITFALLRTRRLISFHFLLYRLFDQSIVYHVCEFF